LGCNQRSRRLWTVITALLLSLLLPAGNSLAQVTPRDLPQDESTDAPVADSIDLRARSADEDIAKRLEGILQATEWFETISVRVDTGVVFLEGAAHEEDQRAWAGNLARNTEGVVAVVNKLSLVEPSQWDLTPTLAQLRELAAAAFRALPIVLLALLLLLLTWTVSGVAFRSASKLLDARMKSPLLRDVVSRACAALVFLLGLYIILRIAGLTSLAVTIVGGTGLLGLAIGFAFRDIAENFLASILISIQRPFAMGDFIEVNGHRGFVQRVNTRATLIMTRDGNHVQIPNAIIYKNEITNYTANPRARQEFVVGIGYDDSVPLAQSAALVVLRDHPAVLDEPEALVLVDELAASTVNLRVSFWVDIVTYDQLKVRSAVIRRTKSAFDEAGISMPDEAREVVFPQGVPVCSSDDKRPAPVDSRPPAKTEADRAVVNQAEGGLKNQDEQIEKQAREARLPEGGENLL